MAKNVKVVQVDVGENETFAEAISKAITCIFGEEGSPVKNPVTEEVAEEEGDGCTYPNCDCYKEEETTSPSDLSTLSDKELIEALSDLLSKDNTSTVDDDVAEPAAEPGLSIDEISEKYFKLGMRVANVAYDLDGVTEHFPVLAFGPKDAIRVLDAIKNTGRLVSYYDNIEPVKLAVSLIPHNNPEVESN